MDGRMDGWKFQTKVVLLLMGTSVNSCKKVLEPSVEDENAYPVRNSQEIICYYHT